MDRNTLIGMLLIGAVLVGYNILTMPSAEERARQEYLRDSIAQADSLRQVREREDSLKRATQPQQAPGATQGSTAEISQAPGDSNQVALPDSVLEAQADSMRHSKMARMWGEFANSRTQAVSQKPTYHTIENEHIRATISSLGGRPVNVELKQYHTWDSLPLLLFTEDSSNFGFSFYNNNQVNYTDSLHFEAQGSSVQVYESDSSSITFRAYGKNKNEYLEFTYGLGGNSYLLDYEVRAVGLETLVRGRENDNLLEFKWGIKAPSKEKGIKTERMATTVYYKHEGVDYDYISEGISSTETIELLDAPQWISFKQQFFSAVMLPKDGGATDRSAKVSCTPLTGPDYTKQMSMKFLASMGESQVPTFRSQFYFGPNHYQTLADLDQGLEAQIDLGWGIFGWVNEFMVIPVFNWLDGFNVFNYGIIILILTLLIKSLLFPLTYRNYKSSAKMRVLKPEIEEINEKHKDGDAMKKQQATMALYRKAGVNPLAGCIPMVLQLPILYAMFRFFPSSIELRQESFLWAEDLSTYDSILEIPYIPFIGDLYGTHVSLFTLLMATSTFFYTRYNMQASGTGNQLPQMKYIMYFMPVMLLFFFNSYSSGLSYYYFLSNVISIAQQLIIKRWFIDEDAIRAKIQANKARPAKKKSRFQARLEQMQKAQQEQRDNQQKGRAARRKRK